VGRLKGTPLRFRYKGGVPNPIGSATPDSSATDRYSEIKPKSLEYPIGSQRDKVTFCVDQIREEAGKATGENERW